MSCKAATSGRGCVTGRSRVPYSDDFTAGRGFQSPLEPRPTVAAFIGVIPAGEKQRSGISSDAQPNSRRSQPSRQPSSAVGG